MNISRYAFFVTAVFLNFFLISCQKESQRPFLDGIPDKDMVFVPEEYPTYTDANISSLGFINSNGTKREEYSLLFAGGAKSMFGRTIYTRYANTPRWSPLGDKLIFTIRNTAPNIRIIDSQGFMYGENCDLISDATTFDKDGYITKVLNQFDRIFEQYQYLIDENHLAIVHFDLINCNVVSVNSLGFPSDNVFGISDETINGIFTISYYESGTEVRHFFIYQPTEKNYQVVSGFFPEVNRDGTLVAYYSPEGFLVVRDLKTETESILIKLDADFLSLAHNLESPSWSPDGYWLAYSTAEGEIYKINIETGENIYITDGWYPDWR